MHSITIFDSCNRMPQQVFEEFFSLMEISFPATERRDRNGFLWEYENAEFRSMCSLSEHLEAVMNYWDMGDIIYIEHFAVAPELRGRGKGAAMMKEMLLRESGKTLVLEAELPSEGEVAKRRIGFYERLGFMMNEYSYIQPPLIKGEPPVPLAIMSCPEALSRESFDHVRETLYRKVYNINSK